MNKVPGFELKLTTCFTPTTKSAIEKLSKIKRLRSTFSIQIYPED